MAKERHSVVFYTSALCNLKCRYCYIDKNSALKDVDIILEESFKEKDYYFNFLKTVCPNPNQLTEIQMWGAEPFLHMDRIYPVLEQIINHYPNFKLIRTSTNFVNDPFFDQFFGFIEILSKYPDRKFEFNLQLSLDGPECITDVSRGKGVTKKFEKKFDEFIDLIKTDKIPNNVTLHIMLKGTLDIETYKYFLDKNFIINYFQYFESYVDKVYKLNKKNVTLFPPKPNMATPSPYTSEDGKTFTKVIQNLIDISKENKIEKYFKYYKDIVLFTSNNKTYINSLKNNTFQYRNAGFTCMSGCGMVGLLPDKKISECHAGFMDIVDEYSKNKIKNSKDNIIIDKTLFLNDTTDQMHFPLDELLTYENKVDCYYKKNTVFRTASIVAQIQLLASVGQIDSKFKNEKEALKAVYFLQYAGCNCMKNNDAVTGSIYLQPIGELRFFLNGASDLIENFILERYEENDK